MRLFATLLLLVALLPAPAGAAAPGPVPDGVCHRAGLAAERAWGIPPGLLAAIGRMESGRLDPMQGRVASWPWTINAAGAGQGFPSREAAVAAVQALLRQGVRSIDIGCFQVNLAFHPDAFATLEEAFDPHANADYAARFLADLHARAGSWQIAVAWYHSADPARGAPYRDRVLADWQDSAARLASPAEPAPIDDRTALVALAPPSIAPPATAPAPADLPTMARDGVRYVMQSGAADGQLRVWVPAPARRAPARRTAPHAIPTAR